MTAAITGTAATTAAATATAGEGELPLEFLNSRLQPVHFPARTRTGLLQLCLQRLLRDTLLCKLRAQPRDLIRKGGACTDITGLSIDVTWCCSAST